MLIKNRAFAGQKLNWVGLPKPLRFNGEGVVNIPDKKLAEALLKNVGWEKVPEESEVPINLPHEEFPLGKKQPKLVEVFVKDQPKVVEYITPKMGE